MPSTPLTCCSIDTDTPGGVIRGYWAMGSAKSAIPPIKVMTIDSTAAKIGRSMKNRAIMARAPLSAWVGPEEAKTAELVGRLARTLASGSLALESIASEPVAPGSLVSGALAPEPVAPGQHQLPYLGRATAWAHARGGPTYGAGPAAGRTRPAI